MADDAMELFWEDLDTGEVHIRDRWQFALKSEFFPKKGKHPNLYTQEFYLFIPNSLQINSNTYTKKAFYLDQTNLIRYKTPEFSFQQLLEANNSTSPLYQIIALCNLADDPINRNALSDELKLFANIVRSTLRRDVKTTLSILLHQPSDISYKDFPALVLKLCHEIQQLRERYAFAKKKCLDNWQDPIFYRQMLYVDEFLSYSISHYLTGLLENVRLIGREDAAQIDKALCDVLLQEKQLSDLLINNGNKTSGNSEEGENVLYRYGLLNKFVLDALHLKINRFSLDQRYQHWIAGISAGIAMTIYFSLFLWLGNVFVINSVPFILLTVVCYILKDRIKDWLRNFSYLQASRWFPDYTTVIKSPDENRNVGVIKESFSFIDPPQLSEELKLMRNVEFHSVLETVHRPEDVLFYKRMVEINPLSSSSHHHGINVIFRFNIHHFLRKAADPSEIHLTMDPQTKKLISIRLPKVYHLNLIIRSTSVGNSQKPEVILKKLKIVIDKNGIKRIEQLSRLTRGN